MEKIISVNEFNYLISREETKGSLRSLSIEDERLSAGQRVKVEYEGAVYTGSVTDYFTTSSGDYALGVNIDVDAGLQVKYFLARKEPVITRL
ncbi:hypothetical protein [Pseudomonas sp. RA_15y_Pfl2_54]|uniref:hypothetical protein n=1 Tax=Pseudomonas sp. RA_15y_Pfl2_54 TaxID=3088704 RepID=UPI0030D99CC3